MDVLYFGRKTAKSRFCNVLVAFHRRQPQLFPCSTAWEAASERCSCQEIFRQQRHFANDEVEPDGREHSITQHIVHRCIVILISPFHLLNGAHRLRKKLPLLCCDSEHAAVWLFTSPLGNIIMIYAEVVSRVTLDLFPTRLSCAYVFIKNVSSHLLQLQSTNVKTRRRRRLSSRHSAPLF